MFLTRMVDRWAVASQQAARRNAMIATTALTQRRAERIEVEDFLAEHARARQVPAQIDTSHQTGHQTGHQTVTVAHAVHG